LPAATYGDAGRAVTTWRELFYNKRCVAPGADRWDAEMDKQTKREVLIVMLASLVPIPLLTAVALILH
jgi:hypothetical protein